MLFAIAVQFPRLCERGSGNRPLFRLTLRRQFTVNPSREMVRHSCKKGSQ